MPTVSEEYTDEEPLFMIIDKDKKLEINTMEAEVIKDVFELYSKGNNVDKRYWR